MKDTEKEVKMQLLRKLMEEMDNSIGGKLAPEQEKESLEEEPTVEVIEAEREEMPISEAEDMIKDKLEGSLDEVKEDAEDEEYEEEDLEEDEEEEEDDYNGSSLLKRLKELKKKKSME